MPLSKILSGEDGSPLLLLSDSLNFPALPLLRAKLNNLTDNFDSIHVFLYETRSDKFLNGVAQRVVARTTLHDFTIDPFGWIGGSEGTVVGELPAWPAESDKKRCALMLDSLTPFLHHWSPQRICQWLRSLAMPIDSSLANQIREVTIVLHRDLHDACTERMLAHTATTLVSLHNAHDIPTRNLSAAHDPTCTVLRKIPGRQPKVTRETFTIDDDLNIRSIEIAAPSLALQPQQTNRTANPTDNLTFNLMVSEKEGVARSKVKLPYVQTSAGGGRSGGGSVGAGGGGLNEGDFNEDDFEFEEDPDDDLDI